MSAASLLCLALLPLRAQTGYETYISPAYFGPNAFQVPQMNTGARTTGSIQALVAGDFILGNIGKKDYTSDVYLEFHFPLFTDRVNLSAWGALHEWYDQSDDVLQYRSVPVGQGLGKGDKVGTFFVSTDIQLLRERKFCPALLLRVGLRTASEDTSLPVRRGYDAAGYFFDLSLGKAFGPVSLAASVGFLCWQVGPSLQNDGIQFGGKIGYEHEYVRAAAQYGGYFGWRKDGDFPRVLYLHMDFGPSKWYVKPYILYQHGFHDWPFDMFRAGVMVDVKLFSGSTFLYKKTADR